jgi:hypothetical protein
MRTRRVLIAIGLFAFCFALLPSAHAVSATNFSLDKSSYAPGDSGKAMITFNNDRGALIQIISVSMSINYFYQDGRVYTQSFSTTGLSMNVSAGANSQPITVQFSLPSTVATGYVTPSIQVTFNTLNGGIFQGPEHDNSDAPTPLLIASTSAQTMTYTFVATTVLFAVIASYFAVRYYSNKSTTSRPKTTP